MRTIAMPRRTRMSAVILAVLFAILMMAEEPRCSLPDPKGPDGWRYGSWGADWSQPEKVVSR